LVEDQKRLKKEKKAAKKTLKKENQVSKMNKELEKIEASANEAKKKLKERRYKVSDDEVAQTQMEGLMPTPEPGLRNRVELELDEIQIFDESVVLDFEHEDRTSGIEDFTVAEEKRLKIEKNLWPKEKIADKNYSFDDNVNVNVPIDRAAALENLIDKAFDGSSSRKEKKKKKKVKSVNKEKKKEKNTKETSKATTVEKQKKTKKKKKLVADD